MPADILKYVSGAWQALYQGNNNSPSGTYNDTGQAISAYTLPARNSSGDGYTDGQQQASGFLATGNAPNAGSGQIGYGAVTTATSNCGSLSGASGCIQVNIGGAVHYVPYW
jgi:hypothetical protein